ncbi:MAG: ribosomal protein L16 [Aigarchaeota archaeon]|nr:ribosomal protein L16 [Aigarchaeota archaeon]
MKAKNYRRTTGQVYTSKKYMRGIDRSQEGMRRAFGKPVGRTARVQAEQPLLSVRVYEGGVDVAKEALTLASKKLPKSYSVRITSIAA